MQTNRAISVIIPCWHDNATLAALLTRLNGLAQRARQPLQLLVLLQRCRARTLVMQQHAHHAHQPQRHGHFNGSDQATFAVLLPCGQGTIVTIAAGIGVSARLHRSPVVTGGHYQGIDAIHDAFVVGGGAVGVGVGKMIG